MRENKYLLIIVALMIIVTEISNAHAIVSSVAVSSAAAAAANAAAIHRRQVLEAERMRKDCDIPNVKICDIHYVSDTAWDKLYCDKNGDTLYFQADCKGGISQIGIYTKQEKERDIRTTIWIILSLGIFCLVYAIWKAIKRNSLVL